MLLEMATRLERQTKNGLVPTLTAELLSTSSNFFSSSLMSGQNKLECLSLSSLFQAKLTRESNERAHQSEAAKCVRLLSAKKIARDQRAILMRANHCRFLSLDGNTVLGCV
jgi:hypothetical protein